MNGSMDLEELFKSDAVNQLMSAIENWKKTVQPYRTAKLWLMYMDLVSILRTLLHSSRTGKWQLYLQSLHEMLPYMAAAGHNNYVKSLTLFLHKM